MLLTADFAHTFGVQDVAKKKMATESTRLPKSPTVKLDKQMHEDLWWYCRATKQVPGDVLRELCGTQVAVRRKSKEAKIAELMRLDAEEDQVVGSD